MPSDGARPPLLCFGLSWSGCNEIFDLDLATLVSMPVTRVPPFAGELMAESKVRESEIALCGLWMVCVTVFRSSSSPVPYPLS